MAKYNNLFLIGPMGAGKSSVGASLARLTGKSFYDSDKEVERRCGVGIDWIFSVEREAGFRQREQEAIEDLVQQHNIVLSTGGGTIVTPRNRDLLKQYGTIIYLKVSLELQLDRAKRRIENRPMVNSENYEDLLIELNKQREPYYTELAELTYVTDTISLTKLSSKIWLDAKELNNE